MDDLGLTKPTLIDRIDAAKVNAVNEREFETARRMLDQMERRVDHNRRVSSAKKVCRRLIATERREKHRPGEPNSGDEGRSGTARN